MVLLDYLKWRNDVSLEASPFNDIDNVILSCLAYIDFGEFFLIIMILIHLRKYLSFFAKTTR